MGYRLKAKKRVVTKKLKEDPWWRLRHAISNLQGLTCKVKYPPYDLAWKLEQGTTTKADTDHAQKKKKETSF